MAVWRPTPAARAPSALTFSYTVGAGQNTSSLAATAVNLNGATITNANGSANLSLSGLTQSGPQVDGTPTLAIDGNGFSGHTTGQLRPTSH